MSLNLDPQYVEGEVFQVCDRKLAALDELENHPNFYVRTQHKVQMLDDKKIIDVGVYLIPKWKDSLVANGSEMLVSYSSNGSHGRKYAEE
jgi:gamma-glutamylcyclotransferase (GGCT)/AIG2-like uncharacterized protein YtfP